MGSKLFVDLLKLIALFGGLWLAFVYIPWFPDDVKLEFPIEQEIELGEMVLEDITNDPAFQPIKNQVVDSAIWVLSKRLLDSLDLTPYDYKIIVVNNSDVNAFAMPGGNIVILSGLIAFSESPEEVAAVIAHEMAHVELRHSVDRLLKELGLTVLIGVLTGGDAVVLSEISRTLTSTFFSRQQEEEADAFALDLLHQCEISPRALGTLFRRMTSEYDATDQYELLMTHPASNSRVKKSFEYELGEGFESRPFNLDWDAVKAEIKGDEKEN